MEQNGVQCIGCGVAIQTDDKSKIGYAPPSALEKDQVICQRCFRLKHYNEIQDVSMTDDDFLKILTQVGHSKSLIIKIIDIFDFNGSFLTGLPRFVGKNPILLVGNKVDLLPKSVNLNKLKQWLRQSSKELGLNPNDIFFISAKSGLGIAELADAIEQYREGRDVYVVGATNVGKSTFINSLIKRFSPHGEDIITTSHFPGTTLDMIDIALDDESSIIDTPGIINRHQMAHYIGNKSLRLIQPKKEIKPKVYQLNAGQTLFLAGLARFDFVDGDRNSFVCYLSNELYIHRTKLENADELYSKQLGELLVPPDNDEMEHLPKLEKHEFTIKEDKMDIVFSGLGWITVMDKGARVAAFAPKGVGVTIRKSLI